MTDNARDWLVGLSMAVLTVLAIGYAETLADWLL